MEALQVPASGFLIMKSTPVLREMMLTPESLELVLVPSGRVTVRLAVELLREKVIWLIAESTRTENEGPDAHFRNFGTPPALG